MILRDYQLDVVSQVSKALRSHDGVLVVLSTGGGKSPIMCHMVHKCYLAGKQILNLCHKETILNQLSATMAEFGTEHGRTIAGKPTCKDQVSVGMIQTIKNRLDDIPVPDFIFADEQHRSSKSNTFGQVIAYFREKNPKVKLVGFTASPSRTDGEGLRANYNYMVVGISGKELVKRGYLSPVRYLCPLDSVKFKRKNGDYDPEDQEKYFNDGRIIGDVMKYHAEEVGVKPCLVACCSLKHADHMRDRFRAAGYTAEAVRGGKKHQAHLFETLKRLETGDLSVCCFVDVLSEGVSVNNIQAILFLRKTSSLIYYLQVIGRGVRFQEGKTCVVIDFVSNYFEHGHPFMDRSWSLEDMEKSKTVDRIETTRCLYCFGVFEGLPSTCPGCGADLKFQRACEAAEMKIKEVDGVLVEISYDYQIICKRLISIPKKQSRMKYFKKMIHENGPTDEIYKINKLLGYKRGFVAATAKHGTGKAE